MLVGAGFSCTVSNTKRLGSDILTKPMGTENPGRPTSRPVAAPFTAPQTMSPFSSGPVVGTDPSGFRPAPPLNPQSTTPFSSFRPVVGTEASGFRPTGPVVPDASSFRPPPPTRFNDPSVPPPPTSNAPPVGPFARFPTPQHPSTTQSIPSHAPSVGQPPFQPPPGQGLSPPVPFRPQQQIPSVPMGSPPQSVNYVSSNVNAPQFPLEPSFPGSRPNLQSSVPGYVRQQYSADPQVPLVQSPFLANQAGSPPPPPTAPSPFVGHQGGYAPPPPVAAPLGFQSMQHPASGPPTGSIQGLVEDFNSLSIGSIPGSIDTGVDLKALPRPLDGDVEPKSLFPMNCSSRFLRLTTSAIPSSQSLVSRWHLPLGAVVCPLAEAPDGVSFYMIIIV